MLSKDLPAVENLDCSRWLIGFCDERLVPFSDPESTYGLYKVRNLLPLTCRVLSNREVQT